jgi:AraC family transcriptional regulator of adaptative response/methylated-DNA-[protein]-cysteine methyltransferase
MAYADDDGRWAAVRDRDECADGYFLYAVRTTGVYSTPSCGARSARREHVVFFDNAALARAAGYRPCRRCRPDEPNLYERYAYAVTKACRMIEESARPPSLAELADAAGFSRFHFHRVFRALTGVTPYTYRTVRRAHRVRWELSRTETVSDAIYSSGFNSNGHFYAAVTAILGMTPTLFRSGGRGAVIRYCVSRCSAGPILVAATDRGVCAMLLGEDDDGLFEQLRDLYPHAELITDKAFDDVVARALARAERPAPGRELLPADVQAVALQVRVEGLLRAELGGADSPA